MANKNDNAVIAADDTGVDAAGLQLLADLGGEETTPESTADAADQGTEISEQPDQAAGEAEGAEAEDRGSKGEDGGEAAGEETDAEPGEAKGEGEGEGESAEEGKGEDEDPRPAVQKRIDKLTAKRREAEERAERAEAKLKELEGKEAGDKGHTSGPSGPDLTLEDSEYRTASAAAGKTRQAQASVARMLDKLEDNPEAVIAELIQGQLLPAGADEKAAGRWLRQADRTLSAQYVEQSQAAALRKGVVKQQIDATRAGYQQQARTQHADWINDKASRAHQILTEFQQQAAWVMQHPAAPLVLADAAYGRMVKERELAAKAKSGAPSKPAKPAPARLAGATTATGGRHAPKGDPQSGKVQKALKTGSEHDYAGALEAM